MPTRLISRAGGYVHDIETVKVLSDEACNLRVLSDRTLYILQNLSEMDVTFLARYGSVITGGQYVPVVAGTADAAEVQTAIDLVRRDLTDMSCDGIVAAINSLRSALANMSCGCDIGQGEDNEDGEEGGTVPGPVGDIVYTEPSAEPDRKCKASNSIHETLQEVFTQLEDYNVDDMGVLGLALVVSIVSGIIASAVTTPIGGLIVAVAGALAAFAARLSGRTIFDLSLVVAALNVGAADLVCSLYNSTSTDQARQAYRDELVSQGLNSLTADLVVLLLPNAVLNVLFFDTEETEAFWPTYTPPIDCSACVTQFSDWVLLPNDTLFGWTTASGFLGSGVIDQGGGSFVLNSEPFVTGPAGRHVIAIVVQGFLDAQSGDTSMSTSPSGTSGGTHTRVSALPGLMSKLGKTAITPTCVTTSQNPSEFGTPNTADDFQLIVWHYSAPWSITYTIDAPPVAC